MSSTDLYIAKKILRRQISELWEQKYGMVGEVTSENKGWEALVSTQDSRSPEGSFGQVAQGTSEIDALHNLLSILKGEK